MFNIHKLSHMKHHLPGEISEYSIGDPVFASGRVCKWKNTVDEEGASTGGEWTYVYVKSNQKVQLENM